jgi:putative endonuclease
MEYVVYVLYSIRHDKIYIGFTGNLINRIYWHNNDYKGYTKNFRPWNVAHVEFFNTKSQAIKREKQLKAGQGRKWIYDNLDRIGGFISATG